MAVSIEEVEILAVNTAVPINTTETAPGASASVGPFPQAAAAVAFQYRWTNGGSAPGAGVTLVFYTSTAAGRWYEVYRVTGSAVANDTFSDVIPIPPSARFRAAAFGNTTNPVAVEVYLMRQLP